MNAMTIKHAVCLTSVCCLLAGADLLPAHGDNHAPPAKGGGAKKPARVTAPVSAQTGFVDNTPLTEEQKIVHVLNRLGFGPRPGDVERVKRIGMSAYIDKQLRPETIDDSAVERKLEPITPYLRQTSEELAEAYRDRQTRTAKLIRARAQKEEMDAKAQSGNGDEAMMESARKRPGIDRMSLTAEERMELQKVAEANQKVRGGVVQLSLDKTVRAVESERQLQEVLVDFWGNHFNIDVRKNVCAVFKIADEREVIRKHSLGKFRDLLGASAKSPAMLVYLDNALSSVPNARAQRQQKMVEEMVNRRAAEGNEEAKSAQLLLQNRARGGINENYAREIMELHSLGVDGGYTQKDVQEVARCLTGWTVNRRLGSFIFDRNRHDDGEKTVLGRKIPAGGGIQDGEMVLDLLASHPATMRHLSTKLCRRLVSDEPPASLVNKCVATWKRTDGDIREVVRTIVTAPEFYSRSSYRQKIKSPFEYAVSAARAVGATFDFTPERIAGNPQMRLAAAGGAQGRANFLRGGTLVGQLETLGQPLYQYQAPTGYPEDSRKWVSSGALISRLNFALALSGGKLMEMNLDQAREQAQREAADPAAMVRHITDWLLQGEVSPSTRATLLKQARTPPSEDSAAGGMTPQGRLVALVLGSPEFQRR